MSNLLKLTLLLSFLPLFVFGRGVSVGQQRISADFKQASIIEVLEEIKQKTALDFLCNHEEINKLPLVTHKFEDATVDDIMDFCLSDSRYGYRTVNQVIIITPKEEKGKEKVKITGLVFDETKQPLAGATVILKGTALGVATDIDGKFTLEIPQQDSIVLIVSFIGMETANVKVKKGMEKDLKIYMEVDKAELNEVVITGYAQINKESFTGNSVTVKREDLLKVSKTNMIQALQVFDPSFRIQTNNQWGSDPNSMPEMYIRGRSGIGVTELSKDDISKSSLENNPNLPTFIMDGFEVSVEKVYDFDPNRIESVTILKDAAATAMYGSRAANGVVIITTVAPKPGKLNVSYSFTGNLTSPDLSGYNLMNAAEKIEAERLAGVFEPSETQTEAQGIMWYNKKLAQLEKGVDTYWLSQPLRTVFNHKHSLYLDGGVDNLRFGLNILYNKEDGVMKGSFRDRMGGEFYLDYRIGKLQVKNQISYTAMKSKESPYGMFSDYARQLPYNDFRDEQGKYIEQMSGWGTNADMKNPLYEAHLNNFIKDNYDEFIDNLSVNWYINDYLQAKGQMSVTKKYTRYRNFTDPRSKKANNSYGEDGMIKGSLTHRNGESLNWDMNALLMYNRGILKHSINFTFGINARSGTSTSTSTSYRGFPSGELSDPNYAVEVSSKPTSAESTKRLFGVLGMLNYTYDNIYLLDVSCRVDGSSEFGSDKRFAPFWSGGLGVNLHNYDFFKELGWFDMLKIRASYGQTGKVDFPSYSAISTYQVSIDDWYKTGFGVLLMALGNPALKWEKTNTFDAGFDISLPRRMLDLKVAYYNKKTVDLITDVSVTPSSGFGSYKDNLGEVRNTGFEIDLKSEIIQTRNWGFSVYGNLAHNENKILKISESLREYNEKVNAKYNDYTSSSTDIKYTQPLMKYTEGGSLTSIWGMQSLGIDPANGKEIFLTNAGTVTHEWNARDEVIIGNSEPDAQGTFGFNLRYRNFSLYTAFMYEFGGQMYNETLVQKVENASITTDNVDKRILTDRWQKPGDRTLLKDIKDNSLTRPSSRFCQDYNMLSLTSITASYDFAPQAIKRIGLSVLRVELGANDLFQVSSVRQERGTSYPFARMMNISLKASF